MIAFTNFLLGIIVPNLISLNCTSLQTFRKNSDEGISNFRICGQFFLNKNYHNFRTSHYIDMILWGVTNHDKSITTTSQSLTMESFLNFFYVVFFQFIASLQPPTIRILDAWCIKLTFSLLKTFYLTKIECRTKQSPTQFSYYCLE